MGNYSSSSSSRPNTALKSSSPDRADETPRRSNLVNVLTTTTTTTTTTTKKKDEDNVNDNEMSGNSSNERFAESHDKEDEQQGSSHDIKTKLCLSPTTTAPATASFIPDYHDDNDDTSGVESTTCSPLLLSFSSSSLSRRQKLTLITPPPYSAPTLFLTASGATSNALTTTTTTTSQQHQHHARQYKSFSSFCSFDQVQEDTKEDVSCFMMNNSRSLSYHNFMELDNPNDVDSYSSHPHHHSLLDNSSPWINNNNNNNGNNNSNDSANSTTTTSNVREEDWLPTEDSDLRPNEQRVRQFWIVTTAALPWMTGTAVNPLLRAAYLSQLNRPYVTSTTSSTSGHEQQKLSTVTLVLPWLHQAEDRVALYGPEWQHATSQDQEAYIREWLATKAQLPLEAYVETGGIVMLWYPARYHAKLSSIFAMGDICSLLASTSTPTSSTTTTSANTTSTTASTSNSAPSSPEKESSITTATTTITTTTTNTNTTTTSLDDESNAVMGDVCILEEPEHVNFYRAPGKLSWRHRFRHVVGIMHTNYKAYASHSYHGIVTAPIVGALSSWMVRAYCDRVIKLSPVLQEYASEKEIVCNVHGIRQEFLNSNSTTTTTTATCPTTTTSNKRGIYFLGKLLWAKGLDRLLELEAVYRKMTGDYFSIDIYGSGPEQEEIQRAFCGQPIQVSPSKQQSQTATATDKSKSRTSNTSSTARGNNINKSSSTSLPLPWYFYYHNHKKKIPARFLGRQDHAVLHDYKIFVNPSVTEVLCTTTAEALAMGKLVIIPYHPSNTWFTQFPNCFQYQNPKEFVHFLQYALLPSTIPAPLSPQLLRVLSWEAATERFLQAASIRRLDAPRLRSTEALDQRLAQFHYELGKGVKGDVLRKVLGGGPVADQVQYMKEPTTATALAVA